MVCPKCGTEVQEGNQFCNRCGAQMFVPASPIAAAPAAPVEGARTSGKAVGSLITGIVGLMPLLFPSAIAAIVLGHMSRSDIRKSNGGLKGSGMALTGLIMGYAGIAFLPFILIIAAIAIPNLLRARMAANEGLAVAGVRSIIYAEDTYRTNHADAGYTCSLSDLGGSRHGSASSGQAMLIPERLASGERSGYRFALRNCQNTETGGTFQVVAYPLVPHQSGVQAFCSDETRVVRADPGGSPEQCLTSGRPLGIVESTP